MRRAGLGFPVVIADQARRHVFRPAAQAGNFRVVDKIFAMAMMRLAIDQHAAIVKRRGRRKNGSRFKIHLMVGPELVEELQGQRPNLLGMFQIATHAAGKGFRPGEHLLRCFRCSSVELRAGASARRQVRRANPRARPRGE